MLLLQQEWRQEPHDRVLRAVEEHALRKSSIHNRTRRNLQLNRLYEAASAHGDRSRALLHNFLQLLLQVRTDFVHILKQLLFLENREVLERYAAHQRTTPERRSMLPKRNRSRELFLRDECSQW